MDGPCKSLQRVKIVKNRWMDRLKILNTFLIAVKYTFSVNKAILRELSEGLNGDVHCSKSNTLRSR